MSILAINWNVDPELFRIGSFAVRWYGLLFVSGFVLGYWMFTKFFERENVDKGILDPLLYTLLLGTLVGARLGHCIFYQPDYYFGSWDGFLEIFQVWKGGLASHGGTIVLFFCMMWFARKYGPKNNFDFVWILDHLCIAVAFAATFIRLGNLFNSEIYGDVTSLPWGFVFERRGEVEPKHPTQLYEALSYFLLGLFLLWLYVKKLDKVYRGTFIGISSLCASECVSSSNSSRSLRSNSRKPCCSIWVRYSAFLSSFLELVSLSMPGRRNSRHVP